MLRWCCDGVAVALRWSGQWSQSRVRSVVRSAVGSPLGCPVTNLVGDLVGGLVGGPVCRSVGARRWCGGLVGGPIGCLVTDAVGDPAGGALVGGPVFGLVDGRVCGRVRAVCSPVETRPAPYNGRPATNAWTSVAQAGSCSFVTFEIPQTPDPGPRTVRPENVVHAASWRGLWGSAQVHATIVLGV